MADAALDYSTAGSTYTQDFDTLATTGTANAWTNNSTIPGFYLFNSGATNAGTGRVTDQVDNRAVGDWQQVVDYRTNPSSSSSRIYSFGHATETPTNRALGSVAGSTGSADPGDFLYALVFHNTTGQTLTSFTLTYAGEQWYDAFNTSGVVVGPHTLAFGYLVKSGFDAASDVPTQAGFGSYTQESQLDFTSPVSGNASTTSVINLNGNEDPNRTVISATVNVTWADGDYLILRWWDDDNNGNDQPHAIDDLSFSAAVPEPAAFGGLAVGALLALAARRRHN